MSASSYDDIVAKCAFVIADANARHQAVMDYVEAEREACAAVGDEAMDAAFARKAVAARLLANWPLDHVLDTIAVAYLELERTAS